MDQEQINKILNDPENEVNLSWGECIFIKSDGSEEKTRRYQWAFSWKHGSWALPYKYAQKELAEMHAALFIYLWLKGVGLPLSDELAYLYTKQVFENVGKT